jgi:hypothetical protein
LGIKIKFVRSRVEGAFTLEGSKVLNFASYFDELHFLKGKNFGQILLSMVFGQIQLHDLQVCNACEKNLFVTFSFFKFLIFCSSIQACFLVLFLFSICWALHG